MKNPFKKIYTAGLAAALLLSLAASAYPITAQDITQNLTCTCGCNMLVSACENMECGLARQITKEVEQMLASGKTKDEIIDYYVQTRGETILAAPTKKGFNLTAWILPFLAIVVAGGAIYMFLSRAIIHRKQSMPDMGSSAQAGNISNEALKQIENELKDFEI